MRFDAWAAQLSGFLSLESAEEFKNTVASSLHKKKKNPQNNNWIQKGRFNYSLHPPPAPRPDQITASSGKGDIQWDVSGAINKEWTG